MPQIQPILAFAVLSCMALAAAVLSAMAVIYSRGELRSAQRRVQANREGQDATWEAALDALSERVNSMATEMRDLGGQASAMRLAPQSGTLLSGMNLTKRAQALRMHRRGDPPEQIAALLDVPYQEVDLLVKVHRIVMSSI
jgi:hypothetical protein